MRLKKLVKNKKAVIGLSALLLAVPGVTVYGLQRQMAESDNQSQIETQSGSGTVSTQALDSLVNNGGSGSNNNDAAAEKVNEAVGDRGTTLSTDKVITGDLYLTKKDTAYDLNGKTLTVKGNIYHTNGDLKINNGTLIVEGSYYFKGTKDIDNISDTYKSKYTYSEGSIIMQDSNDKMTINGDFIIDVNHGGSKFSDGVITFKGNFTQESTTDSSYGDNSFHATDKNTVIFAGTSAQYVKFEDLESGFAHVKFNNSQVFFPNGIRGFELNEDTEINGNILSYAGEMKFNGHTLTINGDFVQSDGRMEIGTGTLNVKGDYRIQTYTYKADDKDKYKKSNGRLIMDKADGKVNVDGSFVTDSSWGSGFTAGTMTVKGDFIQKSSDESAKDNFNSLYDHKVILAGDGAQKISFEDPDKSGFNQLEMQKTGGDVIVETAMRGFTSESDITLKGDDVNNIVEINSDVQMNGYNLTVDGNLVHTSGSMTVNKGTLKVTGDYRLQKVFIDTENKPSYSEANSRIIMAYDEDNVIVDGAFITESSSNGDLKAGTMTFKGNFEQKSTENNFNAEDDHRVVFAGTGEQTISFDRVSNWCGFAHVHFANPKVKLLTGIRGFKLDQDETLNCDVPGMAESSEMNLNGHTLNINGDLIQSSGCMKINNGTLNVSGDYRLQTRTAVEDKTNTASGAAVSGAAINYNYSDASGANIKMEYADDKINVGGSFVEQAKNSSYYLTAGTMTLKGNFIQKSTVKDKSEFNAKDEHIIVFAGDKEQNVSFEVPGGSGFAHVRFENNNVNFKTEIRGFTLDTDVELPGTFMLFGRGYQSADSVLDLNGHTMTVDGDFIQAGGWMKPDKGTLNVKGDYRVQKVTYDNNNEIKYVESTGDVMMENDEDTINVDGAFITDSTNVYPGNKFEAGKLILKGDFKQLSSTSRTSKFEASDTHKIIFAGDKKQTISFEDVNDNCFKNVEILNSNICIEDEGARLGNVVISKDTVFEDGLPKDVYAKFDMNGHNVVFDGDVNMTNNNSSITLNKGNVSVARTTQLSAGKIAADKGSFVTSGSAVIAGGNVEIGNGSVAVSGNTTISDGEVNITKGDFTSSGKVQVKGGKIKLGTGTFKTVKALEQTAGEIYVEQGTLDVGGDYSIVDTKDNSDKTSVLYMQTDNAVVKVGGDYTMASKATNVSSDIKAGTMYLKGDFTQKAINEYNFNVSGSHKVVFDGTKEQNISFESYKSSGFNNVVMKNDKVKFLTPVKGWTVKGNSVINSDITFDAGTLDLNGYTFTVNGDFRPSNCYVKVNKGKLIVNGDYLAEKKEYDEDTKKESVSAASGELMMENAKDSVVVNGDFVMHAGISSLTNGVLTITGDFKQLADENPRYPDNELDMTGCYNFNASGKHKVIFAGDKQQNISFTTPTYSGFADVEFVNDKINIKSAIKGWTLKRDTTINSSIPGLRETMDLAGKKLTVNGDLIQDNGTINVNGGNLTVTKDYRIEKDVYDADEDETYSEESTGILKMNNDSDVVKVYGDFVINSKLNSNYYGAEYFTAGTMYFGGNFEQKGECSSSVYGTEAVFFASGTHTAVFNGEGVQTIKFEEDTSQFNNLVLLGDSEKYKIYVDGDKYDAEDICEVLTANVTVKEVKIKADSRQILRGTTKQLEASVIGNRKKLPSQDVTWSIAPNEFTVPASSSTVSATPSAVTTMTAVTTNSSISASGELYVSKDETFKELTIVATSVADNRVSGSIVITVVDDEKDIIPEPEETEEPEPTEEPTEEPTKTPKPAVKPTVKPTAIPTMKPTAVPTQRPTIVPTVAPTQRPTQVPTSAPTQRPTQVPTSVPTPTQTPTVTPTVVPTAEPTQTPTVTPTAEPTKTPAIKKGQTVTPVKNNKKSDAASYKVTDVKKKTVTYSKVKTTSTKAVVPDTITANGTKLKVTEVAASAFAGNKKVKTVTLGKNITKIGTKAFYNDKNLSQITINGNTVKSIGKNAFSGIKKNCKITIQAKDKKQYNKIVKMIKKSGAKKVKFVYKKKK